MTRHSSRLAAISCAISGSETRTDRPNRCTGSVPESISRLTVRDETLRISAVSSIVRSLPKGCRGPCRRPTLICALARRGEVDLRRVMVSGLLCLGANHGVGQLNGRRDFVSVEPDEPMKWTSRRRPIRRTGRIFELDNAGQRAATGSKAPQSKAFVTAGKLPLTSMSADRGVCAANPLSWLY